MKRIYPSSYALPQGATTKAEYKEGCPRYHQFKSLLPEDFNIPELYSAVGRLGEEYVKAKYLNNSSGWLAEIPVYSVIQPGILVSGRIDYVRLWQEEPELLEVKTTTSRANMHRS